jgi:hypothetical protein
MLSIVEFAYNGPKSDFGGGGSDEALSKASKKVARALNEMGFKWRFTYRWPDGSCYCLVVSPETGSALCDLINAKLRQRRGKSRMVRAKNADVMCPVNSHGGSMNYSLYGEFLGMRSYDGHRIKVIDVADHEEFLNTRFASGNDDVIILRHGDQVRFLRDRCGLEHHRPGQTCHVRWVSAILEKQAA